MAGRKRYSVIRDPVHGDVYLTHEELRILDTREMQRLRGVKQLGTAYLVFPGAVHTRFDHSIGCLHMAQRMIEAVNLSFELDSGACVGMGEEEARVVRIAALVHDATHVPFGHSIEDQDGIFGRHDLPHRFQALFGPASEIGQVLRELGVLEDVLGILEANAKPARIPPYWRQIVGGTIASDILDYLARDAYFTGLKLSVDPRVTSYFKIDRATQNLYIDCAKHDLLREDILSEIVRMLEARYYFSERVYYHHAKVAAGALIARAVETALAEGAVKEADFQDQTDHSVLDLLVRSTEKCAARARQRVHSLVTRFRERRLPKRAAVFPRYANETTQAGLVTRYFAAGGAEARAEAEARISDLARFATGRNVEVIVYCPAKAMQLKEARTHVRWPGVRDVQPLATFSERIPRLADLERSYRDLWKFYVFADTHEPAVLAKVQEIALQEFGGAVNVYNPTAR
ncbi:MAG: HD domain-containing protein [Planctomycetes bacterium]|nr:HD domain-containing protein [Planctomycetota bacterium]